MFKIFLYLLFFHSITYATIEFTPKEKEFIKNHGTIIVGGELDWAPFDFVNKDGEYQGITNDYLNSISKKSGLDFKVITGFTWNELVEMFKNREIDILPAVYYSAEREEIGTYTNSYYSVRDYFFVRNNSKIKSFNDLNGKVLAIPKGYTIISRIQKAYPADNYFTNRLNYGLNCFGTK